VYRTPVAPSCYGGSLLPPKRQPIQYCPSTYRGDPPPEDGPTTHDGIGVEYYPS